MKVQNQKLIIEQLDRKLLALKRMENMVAPHKGWVAAVRAALNMSLRQLGQRLGISAQSVKEIEERETKGAITVKSLGEVANALNMKLVYGFVPRGLSLEKLIEQRANELAKEIVLRTSHTMNLEDQQVSYKRINKAIKSKAEEIKNKMPGYLWD